MNRRRYIHFSSNVCIMTCILFHHFPYIHPLFPEFWIQVIILSSENPNPYESEFGCTECMINFTLTFWSPFYLFSQLPDLKTVSALLNINNSTEAELEVKRIMLLKLFVLLFMVLLQYDRKGGEEQIFLPLILLLALPLFVRVVAVFTVDTFSN